MTPGPGKVAAPSAPPSTRPSGATPARGEVHYVAGYWALPGNVKHPVGHYAELMPATLAMIAGQSLHLYHDDDAVAAQVASLCGPLGIALTTERMPLGALPTARHGEAFLAGARAMARSGREFAAAKEKGRLHLERDLPGSGDEVYRALISIWTSKAPLTARVAAAPPAGARYVAWIDVTIARLTERTNADFPRQTFRPERLNHYASGMRYLGERMPLNASLLLATPEVWAEVAREFDAELAAALGDAYAHDEETVFARVHRRRPELFHAIGAPDRPPKESSISPGGRLLRGLKRRLLGG